MNRTILVIGIILLLIGPSAVSSTVGIAEDKSSNNNFLESANNPKDGLSCDHSAYIISDESYCHLYEFIFYNYTDLNCVCEGKSGYFSSATWSSDNYIYCSIYDNGILFGSDIDTCEMWSIGGGGGGMTGLAYDQFSEQLYGCSDDYLYKIDPETGEIDEIGAFSGGVLFYMIGMAFDGEGTLYGWDVGSDGLWIINTETAEVILACDLDFNIHYSCTDGDFCKECDILYLVIDNCLIRCDKYTGEGESMGQFPDYVSVTGLAIPYWFNDTTPPVTTHSLDPLEPDGLNGWYVSDVNVTLTATDDISGVKEIRYTINVGPEQVIPGDNGSFILSEDGDEILVKYRAIDNAGNVENWKSLTVDIDQRGPEIELIYEIVGGNRWQGWDILLTATAVDIMSGMERVEFYYNDKLQETVNGSGPYYECVIKMYPSDFDFYSFFVRGLICNLEITEEFVNFYSIITFIRLKNWEGPPEMYAIAYDFAGNYEFDEILNPCTSTNISPGFYLFQSLKLPNNYSGHLGRFYISATFDMS